MARASDVLSEVRAACRRHEPTGQPLGQLGQLAQIRVVPRRVAGCWNGQHDADPDGGPADDGREARMGQFGTGDETGDPGMVQQGLQHRKAPAQRRRTRGLCRWHDEGLLDKTLSHDLAGMAESGIDTGSARHRAMKAAAWTFHHAERANREITAVATYRAARKKGMSHQAAMELAENITWDAHFDYTVPNRARFMRGNAMGVITQFKRYSQNITFQQEEPINGHHRAYPSRLDPLAAQNGTADAARHPRHPQEPQPDAALQLRER